MTWVLVNLLCSYPNLFLYSQKISLSITSQWSLSERQVPTLNLISIWWDHLSAQSNFWYNMFIHSFCVSSSTRCWWPGRLLRVRWLSMSMTSSWSCTALTHLSSSLSCPNLSSSSGSACNDKVLFCFSLHIGPLGQARFLYARSALRVTLWLCLSIDVGHMSQSSIDHLKFT